MNADVCQTVLIKLPKESAVYDFLEQVQLFYHPIHTYISVLMCILGTVANFCNIVVLTRRQMRTPVNMILTAMACCDTVVLFSNLIYTTHYSFVAFKECHPRHWSYGWALFLIAHAHLSLVGHSSSIWLSVMLAAIRYQTLRCRGSQSGRPVGLKHAYIAIAVVICSVVAVNSINFLTYKIQEMPLDMTCNVTDPAIINEVGYLPLIADLALDNNCLIFRLSFWISGTVFKVIPCTLLSLLVWLLLRILKEVKENRHRLLRGSRHNVAPQVKATNGELAKLQRNGSQKGNGPNNNNPARGGGGHGGERTDRTTQMLLAIVIVFLVTELPQGIMAMLSGIFSDEFRRHIYNGIGDFLDLFSLFEACTSFIIYCTMSGQFRNEFRRVFIPERFYCAKRGDSIRRPSDTTAYTRMSLFPPSRCDGMSGSYASPSPDERSIAITVVGSTQQIRRNNSPVSPLVPRSPTPQPKSTPQPIPESDSKDNDSQEEDSQENIKKTKTLAMTTKNPEPTLEGKSLDSKGESGENSLSESHSEAHEATLLLNGHPVSYL
ncbi:unnamed protein product, partial [Mesorhabditis belari]|uniref:G-protein coupled receptors family 1 profile domain-containing protein n=1 Tax=Mesorhabditis belari TaxID=2138241 RepID=A0AAF3J9G3_9BILA